MPHPSLCHEAGVVELFLQVWEFLCRDTHLLSFSPLFPSWCLPFFERLDYFRQFLLLDLLKKGLAIKKLHSQLNSGATRTFSTPHWNSSSRTNKTLQVMPTSVPFVVLFEVFLNYLPIHFKS